MADEQNFPGTEPMADVPGCSQVTDIGQFLDAVRQATKPHFDAEAAAWAEHGPAATAAFEATGAKLGCLGGNCPVQAEGDLDGMRFYFRARGDDWQFHVAKTDAEIFDAPVFYIEREYGDWPDAGWMPRHVALGFIVASIAEYRASVDRNPKGENPQALSAQHESAAPKADAQPSPSPSNHGA